MELTNNSLGVEDTVFMLLESLKCNGTFDEFRRHCVTDIDAKVFLNIFYIFAFQLVICKL